MNARSLISVFVIPCLGGDENSYPIISPPYHEVDVVDDKIYRT